MHLWVYEWPACQPWERSHLYPPVCMACKALPLEACPLRLLLLRLPGVVRVLPVWDCLQLLLPARYKLQEKRPPVKPIDC